MAVSSSGRPARTRYEVRQPFSMPVRCALLECRLETGRTHQIRVHLEAIGHPVVGDPVYGGVRPGLAAHRPMLLLQRFKGMRGVQFVQDMAVDIDEVAAIDAARDQMRIPDLVKQGWHCNSFLSCATAAAVA